MRKKLAGVFLLLTLIVSLTTPLTLQAEEQELAYVSDTESLLDDAEWAELEEKAQSVSEDHTCGIYIDSVSAITNTSKHRVWSPKHRLVRNIPETFKGLGLSQQTAFCPQKAMLAGINH